MRRSLEDGGYRVLEAGGAAEALKLVRENNRSIDLLLTDVIMPGKSGRELAEEVALLRPRLPVLFTSGYTDGDIERARPPPARLGISAEAGHARGPGARGTAGVGGTSPQSPLDPHRYITAI